MHLIPGRCIAYVLVCATAAVALPAIAVAADPADKLGFEIVRVSRFGGDADGNGRLDPADGLAGLPRGLNDIPLIVRPTPAACAPGAEWSLRKQGEPRRSLGPQTCRPEKDPKLRLVVRPGDYRLAVRVGARTEARTFEVRDRLVVALGDSVASGEGNPAPHGERWLEPRCHRSAAAGFEQTARLLAQANPTISLTFVSLACSGATIPKGIRGPYRGIGRKRGKRLMPQVSRLRAIAGKRHVDSVLISVGANDVHFADVVQHCIKRGNCPRQPFDPDRTGALGDADTEVGLALGRLPRRYDAVARSLKRLIDKKRIQQPGDVLLSEYFDPTRNTNGQACRPIIGGTITTSELRWAQNAVLTPLNQEVEAAARRHGWRFAGGIADDFRRHGYCTSRPDRWVRRATEDLPHVTGTLHPNERGHLAIADRVGPVVADVLHLAPAPKTEDEPSDWWQIPLAVVVGLILLVVAIRNWPAFRDTGKRAWYVLLPPHRPDPLHEPPEPPVLPPLRPSSELQWPQALVELATRGAGVLLTAVLSLGFVAFVGAAIVWVRFWAARYPADQAVDAVSREELLAIGAQALVLFALLAAAAVLVLWLLDGRGRAIRPTRRGLAVLIVGELAVALLIGDYGSRQTRELIIGFAAGAVLLLFVVDAVLRTVGAARDRRVWPLVRAGLNQFFARPSKPGWTARLPGIVRRPITILAQLLGVIWQVLPLALLAYALWWAWQAEHSSDRALRVGVPIVLALLLFVSPWGVAKDATNRSASRLASVRILLASVSLACLVGILYTDEKWLAGAAAAALALAGLCLAVAAASGERFLPFAVAVFFSVGVFGAVATCLRTLDSPEAQPVALLLKDGRSICGVWVGDGDGRIALAQVELSELGERKRPRPRRSSLMSFDQDSIVDRMVGPLQPIGRAQIQAAVLRGVLEDEHGIRPRRRASRARCEPPPRSVPVHPSHERRIAELVQPELVIDREDGFWPVALRTLFSMEDRRARVCREVAKHTCIRLRGQEDLPWTGGEGEWLESPADALHKDDQHDVMIDALGSTDPARTAREYFLVTRGRGRDAPVSVQFWFFYTYNYQPVHGGHRGLHEGDWESIGMLLSARTHRPRYVWMARHKNEEGRVFAWDEVRKAGNRLLIFAAKGSHATYESCGRQKRPEAPWGLIDDRPQCDPSKQLHLSPETTPLTDLTRVSWACWHGRFGHRPGDRALERVPYESADGPEGPLWQQHFGDVTSVPCRGVSEPRYSRTSHGEEVLRKATAARLRRRAGRLDPQFDSCADWERPPATGAYMVACSLGQLRRYIDSGLERPGKRALRIDIADNDRPDVGAISVPAVRRDPLARRIDDWRVTSTAPMRASVYVSCEAGKGQIEARFNRVRVSPDRPLRVDDRVRTQWRLRDQNGRTVRVAAPHVVRKLRKKAPLACE